MMDPNELPDYIFKELLPASKLYLDEKKLDKTHIFNVHLNDSKTILITALTTFLNKVKGIIRHDESGYLEVFGPIYIQQTCFLSKMVHDHIQITVITKYDDYFIDL